MKRAVSIGITSLTFAAAVTLATLPYGALWKFEWSRFYPWVFGPLYLILGGALVFAMTAWVGRRLLRGN